MSLDTVAARSRRRRLPSVDVPQTVDNDELRRSIEALKEHIRMYEGDSGAPKERFVTVEELELAGLIGTKVQGNFALIDEVLGGSVTQGQQSAQKIVFEGDGLGSGGSGTNLLRDLLDTNVGGVKPGSVLYYENGVWSYVDIGKIDNEFEVVQTFYNCVTFSDIDATTTATWCIDAESTYANDGRTGSAFTFTQTGLEGLSIRADNPTRIYQGTMAQDTPLLILGYEGGNLQYRAIQFSEGMEQDDAGSPGAGSGFYIDYEGIPNSPDNTLHFGSDKPSSAGTIFHIGERGQFRIEDNLNVNTTLITTTHPFQVGPDTADNLRIGRDEIQVVSNSAKSRLDIQPYGGGVYFFATDQLLGNSNNFYVYLGDEGRHYIIGDSTNHNLFFKFETVGATAGYANLEAWGGLLTEDLHFKVWNAVEIQGGKFRIGNGSTMNAFYEFGVTTSVGPATLNFDSCADWDITGLTGEMFVDADLRVSGDLQVDGTFIQYNSNAVDPPTEDVTLEVYRGGVAGTSAIRWNETTDRWEFTNDGSTYQNFVISGEFLTAVVDDTAPQLGGQLDVNGNAIGDGTLELLTFTETASAVNHLNITNAITATGPTLSAAGDDTDVDLNLAAKGTGNIAIGPFVFDADQTVGAGQDNYILTYDDATGLISLEVATGGSGTDLTWTASTRTLASSTGTDAIITLFTAADAGLVPLSGGGTTNFLRADGTWAAPAGGSASNSFETHTVTDTDSGFTWAETGSAVADSATDTLTWVSGTGIDIDVDASSDAIRIANTGIVTGADLVLDDLSDVTETTITTGDVLRWNGTAWVNYADSNFAAASHTHLLAAGATDVTATAAEVNLLDLSGLTAGWVLSADTVTTASWKQLSHTLLSDVGTNTHAQIDTHIGDATIHFTKGSILLDELGDVVETTITTGDVLRWNGTNWVNYADSNYAASSHTHLLAAGATDVTATAAEVNLLDLAALTAGWALVADTATTASWQQVDHVDLANIGTNTHAQIDTHIADSTIHFTQGAISIPLSQISDVTATAAEVNLLDLAGLTAGWALLADSPTTASWQALPPVDISSETLSDLSDIPAEPTGGSANYFLNYNDTGDTFSWVAQNDAFNYAIGTSAGTVAEGNHTHLLAAGATDVTATAAEVNLLDLAGLTAGWVLRASGATTAAWAQLAHGDLSDVGTNSHAQIDTHIADSTIHFTEASISHLNIGDIGTNSHAAIDTHIGDATIHYTKASILLDDLGDVTETTITTGDLLRWNGTAWVNYPESNYDEVNDLSAAVTWVNVPDANITETSVTQHAVAVGGAMVLDNISDVTETTITTGDLLRWSGTAWVNYADSNYAASSHTHLLAAGATDVTATAAEVNLLDLSGLTVGWVLSADSATTASWKAPTGGGGIGGSITDNQIAFGALTADDIEGSANLTFDGDLVLKGGADLVIFDGTNVDSVRFSHDGTDFSINDEASTRHVYWDGYNGLHYHQGFGLAIQTQTSQPYTFAGYGVIWADATMSGIDTSRPRWNADTYLDSGTIYPSFRFETTVAAPSTGEIRLNNATQASATEIRVHSKPNNWDAGFESFLVDTLNVGDYVHLIHPVSGVRRQTYEVSGAVVDSGSYATIPVTHVSNGGAVLLDNYTIVFMWEKRSFTSLRISDSADTDYAEFTHDGTDLNTAFTTTTDWNVTGLAGFNVGNYSFDVDQTVGAGQDNYVLTYDNATGLISLEAAAGGGSQTPWTSDIDGGGFGLDNIDRLEIQAPGVATDTGTFTHDGTNFNTVFANTAAWDISGSTHVDLTGGTVMRIRDAGDLEIYDSTDTNFLQMYVEGTSPNRVAAINTVNIDFLDYLNVGTAVRYRDGVQWEIYDPTDTSYLYINHDGTDVNWVGVNTTDFIVSGLTWFKFLGSAGFALYDTTNADEMNMKHDGTDFNTNFIGTTDWNVNGLYGGATNNDHQVHMSIHRYKDAALSRNTTTTLADDDDLFNLVLDADCVYSVEFYLIVNSTSATPDFKMAFACDQTPQDGNYMTQVYDAAGTAANTYGATITSTTTYTLAASNEMIIVGRGMIHTHATVSTIFDLQWAQNTSDATNVTLELGSWLRVTKMGVA